MQSRKSLPKPALERLYLIDKKIAAGSYPTAADLAEESEVSAATIYRDIEFMRERLMAPIAYCPLRRGYYYTEPAYRLPAVFTTPDEIRTLAMVKSLLALCKDTPFYDSAAHLLETITFPLESNGDNRWYENRIVVPPVASAPVSPEIWEPLVRSLRENLAVVFDYRGTWDEGFLRRRVRPYQLLFDTGVWYLYGYSEERDGVRMFSLPRMKNVSVSEDIFVLPENYDYSGEAGGSYFGLFSGSKKMAFRIHFYDEAVSWLQERIWAADQKIEETDDGVVITFTSTQYNKVLEWVLSRGCTARPAEPEELVEQWEWNVREMKKLMEDGNE